MNSLEGLPNIGPHLIINILPNTKGITKFIIKRKEYIPKIKNSYFQIDEYNTLKGLLEKKPQNHKRTLGEPRKLDFLPRAGTKSLIHDGLAIEHLYLLAKKEKSNLFPASKEVYQLSLKLNWTFTEAIEKKWKDQSLSPHNKKAKEQLENTLKVTKLDQPELYNIYKKLQDEIIKKAVKKYPKDIESAVKQMQEEFPGRYDLLNTLIDLIEHRTQVSELEEILKYL